MPSFQYKIKLPSGSVNEGVIEADDEAAAVAKLKNQRAIVLEIFPVAKDIFQELIHNNEPPFGSLPHDSRQLQPA